MVTAATIFPENQGRRGDRAAEGAALEMLCGGNSTAGSNPALSAFFCSTSVTTDLTGTCGWWIRLSHRVGHLLGQTFSKRDGLLGLNRWSFPSSFTPAIAAADTSFFKPSAAPALRAVVATKEFNLLDFALAILGTKMPVVSDHFRILVP